jgi:hypothetical protein
VLIHCVGKAYKESIVVQTLPGCSINVLGAFSLDVMNTALPMGGEQVFDGVFPSSFSIVMSNRSSHPKLSDLTCSSFNRSFMLGFFMLNGVFNASVALVNIFAPVPDE